MRINKLLFILLSAALLSGVTKNALADNREGAFVLSPSIGPYLFDTNRGVKNNAMFNLGLGYDLTKNWGVEALAGTLHTSTKGLYSQNVIANLYSLDGVYHFSTNIPLQPYLLAGGGVLDFNSLPGETNTQANLNAGAGLEYFLGNSVAFRSDVRDIYTVANGKSDVLVNFGVSLLLGGRSTPAPSVAVSVAQADPCFDSKVVVRFANKSTTVDPIYKTELQQIVTCMQNNPNLKVNLDGYASSLSDAKRNLALSQQRADEVKHYLIDQAGVDSSRIVAQGFGEADNDAAKNVAGPACQTGTCESVVVSMFGK